MKKRNDQRGTSLVGVVVAVALAALLASGLTSSIFQVIKITERSNDRVTALNQVNHAGYWLSLDCEMAQTTSLVEGVTVDCLHLTWLDRYEGANIYHGSTYFLEDNMLKRTYTSNGGSQTITVARHISGVEFSLEGRVVSANITCTPDALEQGLSKVYRARLRATG